MDDFDKPQSMCPNCGENVLDDVCSHCEFAFSSTLKCPMKTVNEICSITGFTCNILGLGYEACQILRGEE